MNDMLNGMVRAAVGAFDPPAPIVEIGSYQVQGQEQIINLRSLFPGRPYTGIDMRAGPGVDLVADIESLPVPDASVGTAIAISTLEHVRHFWKGLEELKRILRPDGMVLLSCPFHFHVHNYPNDYWRFSPAAMNTLLEGMPQRIIGWHGPAKRPANVWAIGFGHAAKPIAGEQFDRFVQLLRQHAHQPLKMSRVIRYNLARVLVGRGPFANYLDQSRWNVEFHNGSHDHQPRWTAAN